MRKSIKSLFHELSAISLKYSNSPEHWHDWVNKTKQVLALDPDKSHECCYHACGQLLAGTLTTADNHRVQSYLQLTLTAATFT
jgi:hypothetical protein